MPRIRTARHGDERHPSGQLQDGLRTRTSNEKGTCELLRSLWWCVDRGSSL